MIVDVTPVIGLLVFVLLVAAASVLPARRGDAWYKAVMVFYTSVALAVELLCLAFVLAVILSTYSIGVPGAFAGAVLTGFVYLAITRAIGNERLNDYGLLFDGIATTHSMLFYTSPAIMLFGMLSLGAGFLPALFFALMLAVLIVAIKVIDLAIDHRLPRRAIVR